VVKGQFSIDNEYLLIWLTQGYVGLSALILIFLGSTISFARMGIQARTFQDRYLGFSLLGILLGVAMCLGTVWLSAQAFMLLFLIIGWSQAILPSTEKAPVPVAIYT
jgi:multisubunit Na+/H+ antiporter MnhF subunit